jgi:hypothetical protein
LRPLKLLIIPLINHQYQLLDRNFVSLCTLHSGFSRTFSWDKDKKKPPLQQLLYTKKTKTTLLIFIATHPSIVAPRDFCRVHFTWKLPCHTIILHPTTTHTRQTKKNNKKFQCYQTPPHLHSMIFLVSTSLKAKIPNWQKKGSTWKTLKPLFVHTQRPKVKNLLHRYMCRCWFTLVRTTMHSHSWVRSNVRG